MSNVLYNPETGIFTRNGKEAGTIGVKGYRCIMVDRVIYKAHRLAFLHMTGSLPPDDLMVDHINGNKSDNRWSNLRLATNGQNKANGGAYKSSKSGIRGVLFHKKMNKWQVDCSVNKVRHFIGTFDTLLDAACARITFAKLHHGEYFGGM